MNADQHILRSQASSHETRDGEWAYWQTLKWREMPHERRLSEWKRHLAELGVPFDSFREKVILDVGCGPVGIVFFLDAAKSVGVDPLADQYEQWNGYWGRRADLIQGGGERLPLSDASFDAVFCINVLDHTFDPQAILREIHRVLKPGGMFILHVDLDSPLRKFHKVVKRISGVLHPQSLTYDWLVTQMQLYFDVKKVHRDPAVFGATWSQMKYEAYWDGLIYRLTKSKRFMNHVWVRAAKPHQKCGYRLRQTQSIAPTHERQVR